MLDPALLPIATHDWYWPPLEFVAPAFKPIYTFLFEVKLLIWISLENVIHNAFSVLEKEIEQVGAKVDLPSTYTEVTVDQAEIQEVIVNLLHNSLYWLKQVPKDARSITVKINRKEG